MTLTAAPGHAADRPIRIVVLGDSLSAGFGLAANEALPAKLERALKAKGIAAAVENAGVSGDTAAGGLARLDWSVPDGTDAVILELGANDALRGTDPKATRASLEVIIRRLKERRIAVLLAGMLAPRNLGPDYVQAFDAIYPELAAAHGLILHPFILEGVAGERALNLSDGLHPTAAGVDVMVKGMLPKVEELIARVRAGKGSSSRPSRHNSVLIGMAKSGHDSTRFGDCRARAVWSVRMPRLFTGLEIPKEIAQTLSLLRGGLPGARWIDPENYHITLRFIGDIDDRLAHDIAQLLDGVKRRSFEVRFGGLMSFGGRKPRAIVVAVEPIQPLLELQSELERLMQRLGLEPEGRKFMPHVTLARLRDVSSRDVAEYLSTRGPIFGSSFRVSRFVLFSSRASVGGGPYVVEADYPLAA